MCRTYVVNKNRAGRVRWTSKKKKKKIQHKTSQKNVKLTNAFQRHYRCAKQYYLQQINCN